MTRQHTYTFHYTGNYGPVRKVFGCVMQFDAYVKFWRANVAPVEFLSPFVARGSL